MNVHLIAENRRAFDRGEITEREYLARRRDLQRAPRGRAWLSSDVVVWLVFGVLALALVLWPWLIGLVLLCVIVPWVPRILAAMVLGLLNLFRVG